MYIYFILFLLSVAFYFLESRRRRRRRDGGAIAASKPTTTATTDRQEQMQPPSSPPSNEGMDLARRIYPVKSAYAMTRCAYCMEERPAASAAILLSACSSCKRVAYCSRTCQVADWKKQHKAGCRLFQWFADVAHPSVVPPSLPWSRKLAAADRMFETQAADGKFSEKERDAWPVVRRFLQGARLCSVCGKTDYDFAAAGGGGGSSSSNKPEWVNCPTCKFGWCCSKAHWEEYRPRHAKAVCDQYLTSTRIGLFEWKHAKKYDDHFEFVPPPPEDAGIGTLTAPLWSTFPNGWEEYFRTRCPDYYKLAPQLPPEFFPAGTRVLSQPVTCLYALYQHNVADRYWDRAKPADLVLHVVGASPGYELPPTAIWEEITHCLPGIRNLRIAFVGPEACSFVVDAAEPDAVDWMDSVTCPACQSRNRTRSIALFGMTYHAYRASNKWEGKPDLIVAFNTGMHEECTESWKQSLAAMLDLGVPALFTSFNKLEAVLDYDMLKRLHAATITDGPVLNPVRVSKPEFEGNGVVDSFFHQNMYCIGFKGRE